MSLKIYPSADVHLSMNHAPALSLRVSEVFYGPGNIGFTLNDITGACSFDLFSPYHNVGQRLQNHHIAINNTGLITPQSKGITFIQVRRNNDYIIARIQVHDDILDWWFGNSSLTVPLDNTVYHTQPSIYALFSDDAEGTDKIGDITGHGYVTLTPADNTKIAVDPGNNGRMRGIVEGDTTLNGSFLTINSSVPVKVIDYGKRKDSLQRVRYNSNPHTPPHDMHNILFIAEGFKDNQSDRDKFERIVTEANDKLFSSSSHTPYDLLSNSFNVWKIYEPSVQQSITFSPQVNDEDIDFDGSTILSKGYFIPYESQASSDSSDNTKYTVANLIRKVGLPLRNESRSAADLKTLWQSQALNNFDPTKVSDALIAIWKKQKSLGILEARDTFYGLQLGQRWGDRPSGTSDPPVISNPDDGSNNFTQFLERIYEWFNKEVARTVTLDPRRHPPESFLGGNQSSGNTILKYIASLHDAEGTNSNVGAEWIPDPNSASFIKSRGLIAIIVNEGVDGGTNMNALTMTAQSINAFSYLSFEYVSGPRKIMRRTPPDNIEADVNGIINTIAHEFGHSFNLNDEYEEFEGDAPSSTGDTFDNVAHLVSINNDANFSIDRLIDPNKIKWFKLPRIRLSDTITVPSVSLGGVINVFVEAANLNLWTEAKNNNLKASLRRIQVTPSGQQLPLSISNTDFLENLNIVDVHSSSSGDVTYTFISLGGTSVPSTPPPDFEKGSLVYIPLKDDSNQIIYVVEKKVLDFMNGNHLPLNSVTDHIHVSLNADSPVSIPAFKPPCKSYKLIGAYEGGSRYPGMTYRPTGQCKMRDSGTGEFCFVCKYLIVNRVNGTLLASLDDKYPKRKKG